MRFLGDSFVIRYNLFSYPPVCLAYPPRRGRREVFAPGNRGFGHFARRLSRSFRT